MAGCDWSIGSECATKAKIDITHYIQNFTSWHQLGYNHPTHGGCSWFTNKITYINNLPSTNNPTMLARRESKIAYWNCMAQDCSCPNPGTIFGCMDDGTRVNDYINNRGTWDFLTLNNTTTSGVVTRVDGEGLLGKQTGSAYPGVSATNYAVGADFDDGSCFYASELPYFLSGCRDSTPYDPLLAASGYSDINGHGTAAVYDCVQSQTVPTTPDPCGYPCVANNNNGYYSQNFDPCANFDCQYGNTLPNYASDMNVKYTKWEDGPSLGPEVFRPFGDTHCCNYPEIPPQPNPDITYDFRLAASSQIGGCYPYTHNGLCQTGVDYSIGGQFLLLWFSRWDVVGNEQFLGLDDYVHNMLVGPNNTTQITIWIYDIYKTLLWKGIYQIQGPGYCGGNDPSGTGQVCEMKVTGILISEIYSINPGNIIHLNEHATTSFYDPNWFGFPWGTPEYHQDSQQYVGPTNPLQPYPFNTMASIHHQDAQAIGYMRIDSPLAGTTVDPDNIYTVGPVPVPGTYTFHGNAYYPNQVPPLGAVNTSRLPSTHWTTPRGNTANLTNHWSGNNLNADIISNPYPTPLVYPLGGGGWDWPHACHSCRNGGFGNQSGVPPFTSTTLHWLEPGPNHPGGTPGDWFYNAPTIWTDPMYGQIVLPISTSFANFITSINPSVPGSCNNAWYSPPSLRGGGGGENLKEFDDGSIYRVPRNTGRCNQTNKIMYTKITYNKDENQEVTRIPLSTDVFTPESTQITTTPPATPIPPSPPPPTTPPPTTPPPTTTTGGGGY